MSILSAIKYLVGIFISKKIYLIMSFLVSFLLTFSMHEISNYMEAENLIIPVRMLFGVSGIAGLFMLIDFITGVVASKHSGEKIKSSRMAVTVGKFLGLLLYIGLSLAIIFLCSAHFLVLTIVFGPVILAALKEYVSIGENLEKRLGTEIYMFSMVDKLFNILEKKFFSKISKTEM